MLSPPGGMTREYRTEAHCIVNVGGRSPPDMGMGAGITEPLLSTPL